MSGALDAFRDVAVTPRGIAPGVAGLPWTVAQLVSIDTTANRATVSILGSQPVALPFLPGDYTGVTTVYVQLDPLRTGAGQMVMGPCGTLEDVPALPPAPSGTVSAKATIFPTWSGTWRTDRSSFDRWNIDRYGGRSDLYQGDDYGSGPLKGLAVYGDQIVGLGATAITAMTLSSIKSNGGDSPVFQGSPHGTKPAGAPSSSGATVGGLGNVDLVASGIAELLRTGVFKGLATVGSTYGAVRGTSHPMGMALSITYQRPA